MTERKNLTAAELIAELEKLPGDTVVKSYTDDWEWMRTYVWGVSGVSPTGVISHGELLASYDGIEDDDADSD